MFGRKTPQPDSSAINKESDITTTISPAKYVQPRVLLVDLKEEEARILIQAGYNISTASFGNPYKITKSDGVFPVIPNDDMPDNYTEQEIIIIDTATPSILEKPKGEKLTTPGEKDLWAKTSTG